MKGWLVLKRRPRERIVIDGRIVIERAPRGGAYLSILAPGMRVIREPNNTPIACAACTRQPGDLRNRNLEPDAVSPTTPLGPLTRCDCGAWLCPECVEEHVCPRA